MLRGIVPTIVINLIIVQNFGKLFMKKDFVKTVSDHFIFHINVMIKAFAIFVVVGGMINILPFYASTNIKVNFLHNIKVMNQVQKVIKIFVLILINPVVTKDSIVKGHRPIL